MLNHHHMSPKTYRCIAIDDDPLFLEQLESFVEEIDWLTLVHKFINPVKAATAIIREKPDIVFLDIEMPYIDGYGLLDWIYPKLKEMDKTPTVVVISAVKSKLHNYGNRDIQGMIFKSDLKTPDVLEQSIKKALGQT